LAFIVLNERGNRKKDAVRAITMAAEGAGADVAS
jgi:hypothetical protein